MSSSTDKVTLQLPRAEDFRPVLHMVLGGIGLRKNLSFDTLDDLQLAVDSVLGGDQTDSDRSFTMTVTVGPDTLTISLEALKDEILKATLSEGQVPPGSEGKCLDVCVLLRSLVDGYSVKELEDGKFGVEMHKLVR